MTKGYDIIGDIHGCAAELYQLLLALGYTNNGTEEDPFFQHPERKALFLGDYIDRGPEIFRALRIVRNMVKEHSAIALMGNHEYNAVRYHTPDGKGGFLFSHDANHTHQHQATLDQIRNGHEDWPMWLVWMQQLPVWLDLDLGAGARLHAVHACFDPIAMRSLFETKGLMQGDITAPVFTPLGLYETSLKDTLPYSLTETILKGAEIPVPSAFKDKDGIRRKGVRLRWWQTAQTMGEMAMIAEDCIRDCSWYHDPFALGGYEPIEVTHPTFIGHYWLTPEEMKPLHPLVACLDSSCVCSGVITAYRFQSGDTKLSAENFVGISRFGF